MQDSPLPKRYRAMNAPPIEHMVTGSILGGMECDHGDTITDSRFRYENSVVLFRMAKLLSYLIVTS